MAIPRETPESPTVEVPSAAPVTPARMAAAPTVSSTSAPPAQHTPAPPPAPGTPAPGTPAPPTAPNTSALTAQSALAAAPPLNELERRLLGDLFAIVSEHAADSTVRIDRARVQQAFVFACEHHADQLRRSGEDFIVHPVGVARICAGMRLDTETLCAALLHDTVEDTSASIEEVRERFGEEIAAIVDGVTKLTGITFRSRDEAQAENYRKMMVAMATDVRVILIKLADRLHNMRTIDAMPKQKQIDKAKETLEIYAPIAHRLGIHAIKWEARGPGLRDAAPAQVPGDQGSRRAATRGARALRLRGRRIPRAGADQTRDRRADRRARQALLLDLLEDDQEGP